jgi:histidine ammonia-lyase
MPRALAPARGHARDGGRSRAARRLATWHLAGEARRVQDPLSFRVVTQVHGAAQWMLDEARRLTELELNRRRGQPVVLASDDAMLSNGNFHTAALALALDALMIACAQVAALPSAASCASCRRR